MTVVVAVAVVQCSRTCNYNLLDETAPAFRTKQPTHHRMTHSQTSRVLVVAVVVAVAVDAVVVDAVAVVAVVVLAAAEAVVDGVVAAAEVACNASIVGRLGCSSIVDT